MSKLKRKQTQTSQILKINKYICTFIATIVSYHCFIKSWKISQKVVFCFVLFFKQGLLHEIKVDRQEQQRDLTLFKTIFLLESPLKEKLIINMQYISLYGASSF